MEWEKEFDKKFGGHFLVTDDEFDRGLRFADIKLFFRSVLAVENERSFNGGWDKGNKQMFVTMSHLLIEATTSLVQKERLQKNIDEVEESLKV